MKQFNEKLQFDVVLDILQTKQEEAEAAREKAERKQTNQKILSIIEEKKDKALSGKSIKELERMLQEE